MKGVLASLGKNGEDEACLTKVVTCSLYRRFARNTVGIVTTISSIVRRTFDVVDEKTPS